MSQVPSDLRYAKSHEWVKLDGAGQAVVGISDYAQASLGDITYVQLPKVGAALRAGEAFGVVESVKAASDLYSPVTGTVTEVNAALDAKPETLNQSPYEDGWLLKVKLAEAAGPSGLLEAAGYAALIG